MSLPHSAMGWSAVCYCGFSVPGRFLRKQYNGCYFGVVVIVVVVVAAVFVSLNICLQIYIWLSKCILSMLTAMAQRRNVGLLTSNSFFGANCILTFYQDSTINFVLVFLAVIIGFLVLA